MIHGLRIYVDPVAADTPEGERVFYTRRDEGPYYLWSYEGRSEAWRFLRLHLPGSKSKSFCLAKWNVLPPALQRRLHQHYMG